MSDFPETRCAKIHGAVVRADGSRRRRFTCIASVETEMFAECFARLWAFTLPLGKRLHRAKGRIAVLLGYRVPAFAGRGPSRILRDLSRRWSMGDGSCCSVLRPAPGPPGPGLHHSWAGHFEVPVPDQVGLRPDRPCWLATDHLRGYLRCSQTQVSGHRRCLAKLEAVRGLGR